MKDKVVDLVLMITVLVGCCCLSFILVMLCVLVFQEVFI